MPESLKHAFKFKRPEKGSVVPAIFIGLGGAGGRLVDRVLAKLEDRWEKEKFRNLYHAFAIDTDREELEERCRIPAAHRIHISDFDKRAYIKEKRGETHVKADPHVTEWAHPWYGFRSESGAGAGQIRIESRLCMHRQLEDDRAGLVAALNGAIDDILHHDNVYRRRDSKDINIFLYGSLAGGTGSGAMLVTAYLIRTLAEARGLHPKVFAYAILPGPFIDAVAQAQREGVDADGYAALKEIEYLMGLGVEGTDRPKSLPFRFSGFHRDHVEVDTAPFDFVWLLDVPQAFSAGGLDALREAVADAMFVQFMTPVHRSQSSNWDNMVRLVQGGTAEQFSLKFGAYGASALVLPDAELLSYLARRVAVDNLDRFVLLRSGAAGGRMAELLQETHATLTTPNFEALAPREQDLKRDAAFATFIDAMAEDEREQRRGGAFSGIRNGTSSITDELLVDILGRRVDDLVRQTTAELVIERVAANEMHRSDFQTEPRFARVRTQFETSARKVDDAAHRLVGRVASGRVLRDLFDEHHVSPLAQRYFLVGTRGALKARLERLRDELSAGPRLRTESLDGDLEIHQRILAKTEPLTLTERLFQGGENRDFNEARHAFANWCSELAHDAEQWLRLDAERRIVDALLGQVERQLASFRGLSDAAHAQRRALLDEAEDLRRGGVIAGSGRATYTLDTEALRDDRAKERLWDRYYARDVQKDPQLSTPERIFSVMAKAITAAADAASPAAIVAAIANAFVADAEETLRPRIVGADPLSDDRGKLGLLLDDALRIEAELVLGANGGAPSEEDLGNYVAQKLRFAGGKSALLATLSGDGDASVRPDDFHLVCAHPAYRGDGRLGALVAGALRSDGFETVAYGWDDAKAVFFYQAKLGMPVYWFEPVPRRMKAAYESQRRTAVATAKYPLHIDSAWENSLPELDPATRQAEAAVRDVRTRHVDLALLMAAKVIQRGEGGWRLVLDGLGEEPLGDGFEAAFTTLHTTMAEEKRAVVLDRVAEARRFMEGPDEPAGAWRDFLGYLAEVANEAFHKLGTDAPIVTHWQHLGDWLRRYAPEAVVAASKNMVKPTVAA